MIMEDKRGKKMLKYKSSKLVLIAVVSLVMAWAAAADVQGQNEIVGPGATVEVNEGETVSFNIYASDDDTDVPGADPDFFLEVDDDAGIIGFTFDTTYYYPDVDRDSIVGVYDWTTGFSDSGTYSIVFHAADDKNYNNDEVFATVTVHVTNVNQLPVLDPIGDKSTDENQNLNFAVSASDPDGDSLVLSMTPGTLPAGFTFTDNGDGTGDFDWTPTFLEFGDYEVTFYAADTLGGSDTETITITVNNINQDPVVALRYPLDPSFAITEGDEDSVIFMAWDPDASEGDNITVDFLEATSFGTTATSTVGDSTRAVITLNPDFCVADVSGLSTFVRVQATDDSGVTVDLFLDFPNVLTDTLRVAGFDRDCDAISYAYYDPEFAAFVQNVTAIGGDAFSPVGDSQEVYLEIELRPAADGVFYIDLVATSDHGVGYAEDEDTVRIMVDVQDKIAPVADSLIASDATCDPNCLPVTVEGYYSDVGSGLNRIIISYLQGNSAAVKLADSGFTADPTGSASYTFVDSFFTVMGLAAVFDAFDGSSADTTTLFGEEIIGNRTSDTLAITYSYTDRGDALVAGSATLFSGTSTTVPQDRWTLFSIPTDIPSPYNRISSIFSNDIDNYAIDQYTAGWRVYSWLPANARFLQMETSEVLFKGMCYFYRMVGKDSYANFNLNLPEGSITLESFDYGSILEANAWNFLGNPYPFPVNVASLVGITGDDVNSWYTYNDNTGGWVVITAGANNIIPAYGGFIVNTGSNPDLVLKSSAVASGTPILAKMAPADEMMIRFELNTSGLQDHVDVGFRTGAAKGFGDEDYLKFTPSLEDRYLNFGVDNFGWENTPGLYRIDVRDYPSEGESWPLMMYSYNVTDGAPVGIKWEIDNASSAYGVWLIDNYAETRIDMLETDSYSFSHIGSVEDGRFAVVAGTSEFLAGYIESSQEALPDGFVLHQNYPNPFNPQTTVAFDLAHSGDVELTVFNVLGRKVKTVFDGKLLKGHHEFDWDGTNDAGTSIASGVYFYRLQTASATKGRKMLLLK
jgi:hypothetical protein